ncbi:MAG: arsenite methyltransferase [Chloroflexi bacterium]|nr:arsenite methyltransferase [Chloroflexota bacterium]
MAKERSQAIKQAVKERYATLARRQTSCCPTPQIREGEGMYSRKELQDLPQNVAEFSLGCGNPTAIAELREGETVLDLGSGGGIDCFLAAQKVGKKGRVIGVDMTPEMVFLARENTRKMGLANVEFRLGEMEHLPLEANSVDVIISNCVINLAPDKDAVFKEALRVLKPGGRLCISDIVLKRELSLEVKEDMQQWTGCVAGALKGKIYLGKIARAGFVQVTAQDNSPREKSEASPVPGRLRDYISSVNVSARKPSVSG